MRYKVKSSPQLGDIKEISKFVLIPRFDGKQWVWLENATLVYKYSKLWFGNYDRFERPIFEYMWDLIDIK